MNKILKWIGRVITFLLALILCANIYTIAARSFGNSRMPTVFGFANAVVVTGSMEPTIHVNDMIIVHSQKDYQVGDIVTYLPKGSGTPVTHRIIEKNGDKVTTQGDANNGADPEIKTEQIVGKVIMTIPRIGAAIQWMSTPMGMMILVLAGFALVAVTNAVSAAKEKKKPENP